MQALAVLAAILVVANALPSSPYGTANVLTVPAVEAGDGDVPPANVKVVQSNCRIGQAYVDGRCIDVWRDTNVNAAAVPSNDWHGSDRSWKLVKAVSSSIDTESTITKVNVVEEPQPKNTDRNIISVPPQCPPGWRPDHTGYCREIFD